MIKDNEIYRMPNDFEIGSILSDCAESFLKRVLEMFILLTILFLWLIALVFLTTMDVDTLLTRMGKKLNPLIVMFHG